MRITSLWIERSWRNRLAYWLYEQWCNEPFFPEGKVVVSEYKGFPDRSSYRISWIPKRFVPGVHEAYIEK